MADHAHRWRIESPTGPVSQGQCKGCGATKEFKNFDPVNDWVGGDGGLTGASLMRNGEYNGWPFSGVHYSNYLAR